ncbi:unnamed protein product [Plutella xylostella]|uniref:(diamondback moth) hypothetical protein n=1 Tax=Plutella xylostella TaxID=51655 RepID=A0A8S4FYD8_PLUXY|nr:unnamed protein product [Plutella xylostella]
MPYESAYPLTPDVDPGVIRARANSSSRKKPVVTFISGDEAVVIPDKSIAGVNKPLSRSDRSEIELDSFAESLSCTMHSTWLDKRALEHRFTFTFVSNLTENGVKIYERLVARKISYGISENTPSHLGF